MAGHNRLTDKAVKAAKKKGRVADGGNLYLQVEPSGTKSWTFIYKRAGRQVVIGLGGYPALSLSAAREIASGYRQDIAEGRSPDRSGRRGDTPAFSEVVSEMIEAFRPEWRNEKHAAQWEMTLGPSYCKAIQNVPVNQIGTDDVLAILRPIWTTKAETASRLRGRLERVFGYARARGWRTGENPAIWKGHLDALLPKRRKLQRGNHPALPWPDLPDFMARLSETEGASAACLRFTILTAARSGEALNMPWSEIDEEEAVWSVPGERMKSGRPHRVPLSEAAMDVIRRQGEAGRGTYVFQGGKKGRPLSNMAMQMQMRRMGFNAYTPHGFRSSFADWAHEATEFRRELVEAALAHVIGDQTERAYRRSDALDRRRVLMEAWSAFLIPPQEDSEPSPPDHSEEG